MPPLSRVVAKTHFGAYRLNKKNNEAPFDYDITIDNIDRIREYLCAIYRREIPHASMIAAWDQFYRDLLPFVESTVRAYGSGADDLDDAVQEIWLKIVSRMREHHYDQRRGRFLDWLFMITRHHLSDLRRRARIRRSTPLSLGLSDTLSSDVGDPAAGLDRESDREAVRLALLQFGHLVSEVDSRIMHLRWVDGLSTPEIAATLNITPERVRLRHHRALKRLKELIVRGWDAPNR